MMWIFVFTFVHFAALCSSSVTGGKFCAQETASAIWALNATSPKTAVTYGGLLAQDQATSSRFTVRNYGGVNGREVKTRITGFKPSGAYRAVFDCFYEQVIFSLGSNLKILYNFKTDQ
ncbi:hypothetical protein JXO59_02110 [candidate division KSB1 bacterium]|nr:hypothetical protein [candidate division KSB1 bacterium]